MSIQKHTISLTREGIDVECDKSQTILDATLAAGINHIHACGGNGKCSTCRIAVEDGLRYCNGRNEKEQSIADKLNFPEQIRLACQTQISGDIQIKRMISDDIDMEIVNKQFADDSSMSLGSEKKVTIVFTDIENYTPFVAKFPPYDVVHMLNRYLMIMNQAISDHYGFVSDVVGDGILAVFGHDTDEVNSVHLAVLAIHDMHHRLEALNKYLFQHYNGEIRIRAGIHYGPVIMGPFDLGSMKKLAVIGDHVNIASRIEEANKVLDTQVLLSAMHIRRSKNCFQI